jgi:hypothetical protein
MPGFNGTGPSGRGPLSGGGRGYCAIVVPPAGSEQAPYGYAGLQGSPVIMDAAEGVEPTAAAPTIPRPGPGPWGAHGGWRGGRGGDRRGRW